MFFRRTGPCRYALWHRGVQQYLPGLPDDGLQHRPAPDPVRVDPAAGAIHVRVNVTNLGIRAAMIALIIIETIELPLNILGMHFVFEPLLVGIGNVIAAATVSSISPFTLLLVILTSTDFCSFWRDQETGRLPGRDSPGYSASSSHLRVSPRSKLSLWSPAHVTDRPRPGRYPDGACLYRGRDRPDHGFRFRAAPLRYFSGILPGPSPPHVPPPYDRGHRAERPLRLPAAPSASRSTPSLPPRVSCILHYHGARRLPGIIPRKHDARSRGAQAEESGR